MSYKAVYVYSQEVYKLASVPHRQHKYLAPLLILGTKLLLPLFGVGILHFQGDLDGISRITLSWYVMFFRAWGANCIPCSSETRLSAPTEEICKEGNALL